MSSMLHPPVVNPPSAQTTPAIAMIGADIRLMAVTAAFGELLGYAADELTGRVMSDLWNPGDASTDRDLTRKVVAGELAYFDRVKLCTHRTGKVVRALLVVTPARGPAGEIYCAIARLQPITDSVAQPTEPTDQIERIRKAMMW